MGLSLEEQEVTIGFMRTEETCTLYTSDSTWITKMENLCKKNPEQFKRTKQTHNGNTYEFPKRFITIRSKDVKIELTEEQRKEKAEIFLKRLGRK